MNENATVLGIRCSHYSYYLRISEYADRLAGAAERELGPTTLPSNAPHVQALRDFAMFMRGLNVDNQLLRALQVLNEAMSGDYEPGREQKHLLAQVATYGRSAAPPNDKLLEELVAQAAVDYTTRYRERVSRLADAAAREEATNRQLERERSARADAEERAQRAEEQRDEEARQKQELREQNGFLRAALGAEQADEIVRQAAKPKAAKPRAKKEVAA